MSQIAKDKIRQLPNSPGVYHFLDKEGQVLYAGKAKNLKNRVKQYFLKELNRGPAIPQMVAQAEDIHFIETESEIEAVLLEADLIKKLKPKYNVRLKDDKSFLVIKITKSRKLSYFAEATQDKKVESKKGEIVIASPSVIPAPCLPAGRKAGIQVGQDPAGISKIPGSSLPAGRQARDDIVYDFPIVELVRFKNVDLKDKEAEYFGPYPAGLLLKKSLRYLRKIFPFRDCSKTKFQSYKKKNRPCVYGDIGVCSAPCVGNISQDDYKNNIRHFKSFLKGRKKEIISSLETSMKQMSRKKKYEEAMISRNRIMALTHLKDVRIGLRDDLYDFSSSLFTRIECYDISNIMDKYAVGSMVVFTSGKADKSEYRKFKVKSRKSSVSAGSSPDGKVESIEQFPSDDLSRLKQILERRFETDWSLPNLVIIDGGEQQLRVAKEALKEFNLSIPLVSISKGKRRDKNDFHFSDSNTAVYFKENKELESIAISARDEAHRFAINYYRKVHKKELFT